MSPLTIKDTQKALKDKEFSLVSLIDEYAERIEENKDLNAYLTVSLDEAYKKAKEENDKLDKPLSGVTVAYKDLFLTEGIRTTAGSKVLEGYLPQYSATVVRKMEEAGAIILGKTNCDAWAHGASGENSDFGPTLNPWDKKYVPGGSSSGSAVAVSSGLSLTSFGTDTGGSIRQPASFCGVVGLKPTYGAVSRYGIISMASSLDCPGPITQTVEDAETLFNIIKGPDGQDATVTEKESPPLPKKMKIGIPKEYFIEGLDKEVERSVLAAVQVYKKLGAEIVDISLPHTKYAIDAYYVIQPAEVSSNLGRYDGIRYGNARNAFGEEARRRIMLGTYVLSAGYYDAYYLKAQKVRRKLINDFDEAYKKVDAILAPVSPTSPFKLGEKASDPLKMYLADVFTVSANIVGIPALAIPESISSKGLPLGFQLMGPRFGENILFELGKNFQKEVDYKPRLPI